jgi:hypothetical protein
MNRLVSGLLSVALLASLATSSASAQGMGMNHHCKRGFHWVKGYKKRNGTYVKGYCARDRH